MYLIRGLSVMDIARRYGCSANKINYWMRVYGIKKRSISEAVYLKKNPNGDPFTFVQPKSSQDWFLFGLGLGLYWGEGNKKNKLSVRLGNTDPDLVRKFIEFLKKTYQVDSSRIRFGLQIFSDMSPRKALIFWSKYLRVPHSQFGKVIVTPARSVGTYREKTQHGVLTVYFSNKKLRDVLYRQIELLR